MSVSGGLFPLGRPIVRRPAGMVKLAFDQSAFPPRRAGAVLDIGPQTWPPRSFYSGLIIRPPEGRLPITRGEHVPVIAKGGLKPRRDRLSRQPVATHLRPLDHRSRRPLSRTRARHPRRRRDRA